MIALYKITEEKEEFECLVSYLGLGPVVGAEISSMEQDLLADMRQLFGTKEDAEERLSECLKAYVSAKTTVIMEGADPSDHTLCMPDRLKLLSPYFKFSLFQLPADYQSFVQTYYKRKCKNCDTQVRENVVCLLCGEIQCW